MGSLGLLLPWNSERLKNSKKNHVLLDKVPILISYHIYGYNSMLHSVNIITALIHPPFNEMPVVWLLYS